MKKHNAFADSGVHFTEKLVEEVFVLALPSFENASRFTVDERFGFEEFVEVILFFKSSEDLNVGGLNHEYACTAAENQAVHFPFERDC
jgi:hypothetical protein